MKKYLALLAAMLLLLGLAACGGNDAPETSSVPTVPTTVAPETTAPTTVPTTAPVIRAMVGDLDLTGLTPEAAVQALNEAVAGYNLNLTVNGVKVTVSGTEAGMKADEAAVKAMLEAVANGTEPSTAVFTYDTQALTELLNGKLDVEPKNASISYNSSKKQFTANASSNGTDYDAAAAAAAAGEALARMDAEAETQVETQTVRPTYTADGEKVQAALKKANGYLNVSLTYTYSPEGGETAKETIGAATLAGFVSIGDDMSVSISKSAIESYASQMSSSHSGSDYKGKFVTTGGSTISSTVTYYGQRVNKSALTDDIYNCVKNGTSGTRTAPYNKTSSKPYGGSYVEIDLSAQKLWLYKDGERIISTNLVSGSVAEGHCTPTGVYSIYSKQTDRYLTGADYRSYVNYWMPFLGGYGLHDATWRSSFGGTIYHYDGSHGCVNLPKSAAKTIYNNVSVGTKVILYGGAREVPDLEQKLTGTTSYTVSLGDAPFKLDVKAKYKGAELTYSSDNEKVVKVSSNGTVTVVGEGTATITVKAAEFEFYTAAELKITITVKSSGTTEPTEPKPTEPPVTEPSEPTEPKPTEPQPTEPPVTEPPATEPPATEPPATEPPATEPPVTEPPVTEPPRNGTR